MKKMLTILCCSASLLVAANSESRAPASSYFSVKTGSTEVYYQVNNCGTIDIAPSPRQLAWAITAFAFSNPFTSPTYSGGYPRDVYYRLDGRALVITSSANSNLLTVDACAGTQTAVAVTNMEVPTNGVPCILFWAHGVNRTEISLAIGNMKMIGTGKRYVFARPTNATENLYEIWDKFEITGANATVAQLAVVTLMPNGKYRVVNNSHSSFPMEINGVSIPWVADLDPTQSGAAAVIPRPDLKPSLTGALAGGVPKIHSVDVTSRGEIIHLGYFNTIGGITVAQKGFIENPINGTITDLAIDNDALVFATQYVEIAGVGYIGYTGTAPSSGVIRFNPTTYALSAAGGGFGITPMDFLVVNGRLLVVGFWRASPAPNGTFGEFNPITNNWTALSGNLYTSPGLSSAVNTITPIPNCPNCFLLSGNFSTAASGQLASGQNYLTKACELGSPLPLTLTEFTVQLRNADAKFRWSIEEPIEATFELERSGQGTPFTMINRQTGDYVKEQFSYNDPALRPGVYQYRLKMIDKDGVVKYSDILFVKIGGRTQVSLTIFPNPAKPSATLQLAVMNGSVQHWTITTMNGQVISMSENQSVGSTLQLVTPRTQGTYILSVTTDKGTVTSKILVQ